MSAGVLGLSSEPKLVAWVRVTVTKSLRGTLGNIKNIFRVDTQLYQHEWELGKREIV